GADAAVPARHLRGDAATARPLAGERVIAGSAVDQAVVKAAGQVVVPWSTKDLDIPEAADDRVSAVTALRDVVPMASAMK
ncbi:MAG TPA: hypothetical protein VNT27_11015, partial [Propionibacteriaceae bacterium]|nr:hypothetical protein [Propionibacteriaceae bacterium]